MKNLNFAVQFAVRSSQFAVRSSQFAVLIFLLMQGTINNKVNAQIIHGPDNVPAGTYYVDGISPYIKYHWDVTGETSIVVKAPNVAQGAIDEKMFITWDLNAQEHKIEIIEEPLFSNNSYTIQPVGNNLPPPNHVSDDQNIQSKIDLLKSLGGGTLTLGPGTFWVTSINLAEGVRIEGTVFQYNQLQTTVKRPDFVANDSINAKHAKMFTSNWGSGGNYNFSFLATDERNSKPIEFRNLIMDGNKTRPKLSEIDFPNYNQDLYEATAMINLWCPNYLPENGNGGNFHVIGPNTVQIIDYNLDLNFPYVSGGPGRLKVFINNCHFMNSGGDAVLSQANVDLTMNECTGTDIYRGTYTITGGSSKARINKVNTFTTLTNPETLTKSIDFEVMAQPGYGNTDAFRIWIDNCDFDKNVQFDFHQSNFLMTYSKVINPPTILEGEEGTVITNHCELAFGTMNTADGESNYILAPNHAKFSNTTFNVKQVFPLSCFNGIFYKHLTGPPVVDAHLGFDNCTFNNQTSFLPAESHGIYVTDPGANNSGTVQFFFNSCTNYQNKFLDLITLYAASGGCPVVSNPVNFAPGVITNGMVYTGGESEDQMKTHFGIRKITPGPNDNDCDPTFTINHPNADIWFNPKASEMLAVYGNQPWPGPGKQLYINGTFDIDANVTLDNCHLWFTPDASVLLNDDHDLLIQGGSTLEAACFWWHGIEVPNADNLISITGGSTIKNALHGVQVYDNAVIQVDDANFVDNGEHSISLMNMSANQYAGYIRKSNFTTQQNLPGGQFDRSVVGIRLRGVKEINIGDFNDPNSGNTFEGMHTGIRYGHWTNSNAIPLSHIGIYNNSFTNIHADGNDEYAKMVNCYTDADGAAIYCKADANPNNTCHLDVRNTINNINSPSFSACDKAIVSVGNSLEAIHLNIYNNVLGIMCNSLYNRNFNIANNSINNVHMGIQLSGNQRNVFVTDNTITAFKTIFDPNFNEPNINTYAPIGINYQMQTSWKGANIYQFVKDNSITINRIAGIGILNANVGKEFEENGNMVLFNTNSIAPTDNYNIQTLLGYFNVNNYKAKYIGNTTIGPGGNPLVWQARTSISMFMNESRMCKLDCNRLKYTRFGFFVWGNNTTTETNVTHNKCNANAIPWFFVDNANKGTFGNVGDPNLDDNGNEFVSTTNPIDWRGMLPNPIPPYSLVRLAIAPAINQEQIITAPGLLQQSESISSIQFDEYVVTPAFFGYTDPCTDDDEYEPEYFTEPDVDSNEYNSAMAVAQDSMAYINFPTVGSWIDQYKLYMELDTDSLLLNSNPELLYFYNTTSNQTIGDIKYAAEKIALLYDSTTNASNDSLRYAEAVAANTLISSANDWEMNEKTVNDVLLFMYDNPIDSIPLYMKEDMQFLASSCPFVEGTAVYRARTIYSLWEPNAIFDDRIICIQGQNKNQDNTRLNIDSLIESQIGDANVRMVSNNISADASNTNKVMSDSKSVIKVFPNPASTFIIVEYNCESDGELILYNSLGQEILKTSLEKGNKKVQIQINDIANGMYQYKCKFENCIEQIGKLTIEK